MGPTTVNGEPDILQESPAGNKLLNISGVTGLQ